MAHVDAMLADEALVSAVHHALVRRHPQSRRRGRLGFPAEVVLRLLVLKHIRNWSYAVLEREVRANLVYRDSPVSVQPRCPTQRPWVAGAWRWGRPRSIRSSPAAPRQSSGTC